MVDIEQRLLSLVTQAGQRRTSRLCGLSQGHLSDLVRGRHAMTLRTADKLARVFGFVVTLSRKDGVR